MAKLTHDDIARRIIAVRGELKLHPKDLAPLLGTTRPTYLGWEAGSRAKKPSFPSEEGMIALCDLLPGLTMDYLYRGKLDTMRTGLAIRLIAHEIGLDPDAPGFDATVAAQALVAGG